MPNSYDFNHFEVNPTDIQIERSLFNMDHSVKFSADVGMCVPFEVIECLPGDTFSIDVSKVVRLQPMVTPIMDEVIQDTYFFFCPSRLVWSHWKEFCGENTHGPWAYEYQNQYQVPTLKPPTGGWNVGSIADYMGIPPKVYGDPVNALPFRAYALICDEWFRSEAVMNPVHVYVDDQARNGSNGSDQVTDIELGGSPFIACKFFDYFTAGLPSPQRGNAASVFPNNLFAPVVSLSGEFMEENDLEHPFAAGKTRSKSSTENYKYFAPHVNAYTRPNVLSEKTEEISGTTRGILNLTTGHNMHDATAGSGALGSEIAANPVFANLFSELNASFYSINDLRNAFAVQRYLEKSARYGGRYISFLKGFFGVTSSDARLQRTEYLGGSRLSLNINSVEQTSATQSGTTPLGNVAGMSVTGDYSSDVNFSCEEHGYIIGISVLRYHHSYQQGLNRMWSRRYFTDFYLPTFAFLGEQEIKNKEIYYSDNNTNNNKVFAYQERWAEYRYLPNRVAGEMRSVATTSLDMWHLGDYYNNLPTLSPEWLREDKTMLDRCLAVTSEVANQCICDYYIKIKAARPLPMYSIPGLIDHY